MGANAQTAVPTFTASQVLTAAQMNQSARTGVPVFSSTVTRDAAFGGTGEKTLAEGQLCYVEGVGLQSYNAAGAWVTWGAAPSSGALVYITGATFTTAATVSMASGVFTSTYDNYKVILNISASSTGQVLSLRVNNAGTPRTAANYNGSKLDARSDTTTVVTVGSSSATSMNFGATGTGILANYDFTVYGPAISTRPTQWSYTGAGVNDAVNVVSSTNGGGQYSVSEANDGLTFFVTGTITGTYRVYGIVNS